MRSCTQGAINLSLVFLLLLFSPLHSLANKDFRQLEKTISRTGRAIAKSRVFSNLSPTIDLKENKKVLQRILAVKTRDIFSLGQNCEGPGGLPLLLTANPPRKVIVDERFSNLPHSQRAVLIYFAKAYGALAKDLAANPSILSLGLCNLVAQEVTSLRELSTCPYLQVETAIAALLVKKQISILWAAFPDGFGSSLPNSFHTYLRTALRTIGCRNPGEVAAALLKPLTEKSDSEKVLQELLPNELGKLSHFGRQLDRELPNLTYRFIWLNACYDKYCLLLGEDLLGQKVDAATVMQYAVTGDLQDEGKELLAQLSNRRRAVLAALKQELKGRKLPPGNCAKNLVFSPAMVKWAFRFIHNYSDTLVVKGLELRQKLEEKQGLKDPKAQDEALKEHMNDKRTIGYWASDNHLRYLLKRIGKPNLTFSLAGG